MERLEIQGQDCNSTYLGEVRDGVPHGTGKIRNYLTGTITGQFKDGKPHGYCVQSIMHPIDWMGTYNGFMNEGKRNGFGSLRPGNRYEYIGFWSCDKPNGLGILTDKGGEICSFMQKPTKKAGRFEDGEFIESIEIDAIWYAFSNVNENHLGIKDEQYEHDWDKIQDEAYKNIDDYLKAEIYLKKIKKIQRFFRNIVSNQLHKETAEESSED